MRIVCERADGPWNEVLGFRGVRICVSAERQYRWEKPRQGPSALPRREVRLVRSAVVARYGATFRFGHAVAVEAVGPDSVRIGVRLPFCSVRSGFSHGAGAVSYMLLEPSALVGCGSQSRPRDYAVGDTIPVMACTAGIPKTAEHGGQRLERFDFCSLRDDSARPRDWYNKYGIRHCVWYEVCPADRSALARAVRLRGSFLRGACRKRNVCRGCPARRGKNVPGIFLFAIFA